MKGQRIRSGQASGPAVEAVAPDYQRQATAAELASAVLQSCLSQIMPNASEVASGSRDPDHVHQLRVGIRRLRTALRDISGLAEGMDPAWEVTLVDVFRALGRHRDHGHLTHKLQPLLQASGGPALNLGPEGTDLAELGALVRSPAFQDVLLGLAGFAHRARHTTPETHSPTVVKVKKDLRLRLQKLHFQVLKDGKKFLSLNETRQHDVRKRLKRIRYLAEFSAPLFSGREVRAFIAALKPAQDALGLHNDELMAAHAYRALAVSNALAWFGVGWLTARCLPNARRCMREVKKFAKVQPFWD
jgi:CHAD domain-containing protein